MTDEVLALLYLAGMGVLAAVVLVAARRSRRAREADRARLAAAVARSQGHPVAAPKRLVDPGPRPAGPVRTSSRPVRRLTSSPAADPSPIIAASAGVDTSGGDCAPAGDCS